MLMYWILFLLPAYFALKFPFQFQENMQIQTTFNWLWKFMLFFLVLVIGYRYEVGGDWLNYLRNLNGFKNISFDDLNLSNEPGYEILTWLGDYWGGVYLFNCVGSYLFVFGLLKFCLSLRRPWLALTIATPYMVIVVGMGYSRQAVSVGVFMLGLCALNQQKTFQYLVWILIGYLFHHTSILLIPLVLRFRKQSIRGENLLLFLILLPVIYQIFKFSTQKYMQGYFVTKYNSAGALTRLLLNCIPGCLYLLLKEKFHLMSKNQHKICELFSYASIGFFILYFFVPSSAALDRFALYFQSLQLLIWSHMPDVWGKTASNNRIQVFFIISFYALVEFTWLFFSQNSSAWLPYKFYWWEVLTNKIWFI